MPTNAMLSAQLLSQNFPLREMITVSGSTDTRTERFLIHPSNRHHQLRAKEHQVFQNCTISAHRFRERTPKPGLSMAPSLPEHSIRQQQGKIQRKTVMEYSHCPTTQVCELPQEKLAIGFSNQHPHS